MNARTAILTFALSLLALIGFAANAQARTIDHGGVYFSPVEIEAGQVVHGDVTVVGSNATVEGEIDGDLTVIGGDIYQRPGSIITGHIDQVGSDFTRNAMPWGGSVDSFSLSDAARVVWKICWSAIVLLFFLIFPMRTRMALDRLEKHPGLCAAIGLVGWVAVIPIAILLVCTLILIPLIPVELIAIFAAVFIGKAALSLLVGRRLHEMLSPRSTPQPLTALVMGLALITAAELVPFVGGLVSALVGLVGLGAAILSFVKEAAFAGNVTPQAGATIGGPPMTIG